MKFMKEFYGVKNGEIYPTRFEIGDECPQELEDAAIASGVFDEDGHDKKKK